MTIGQLQTGYNDGTYTVKEIVSLYLDRIIEIDKNGPELNSIIDINPDAMQIADELDRELAAISGYPAITVPMGFVDSLPVGITFFGRAWSEPLLIEVAYSYEQGTTHRKSTKYMVTD